MAYGGLMLSFTKPKLAPPGIVAIIRNTPYLRILRTEVAMKASATELNKHPGRYISQAIKEPVIIEKSGHPVVVMVSYEHYLKLEDAYWGELATAADKEKSLGIKKSKDFLSS